MEVFKARSGDTCTSRLAETQAVQGTSGSPTLGKSAQLPGTNPGRGAWIISSSYGYGCGFVNDQSVIFWIHLVGDPSEPFAVLALFADVLNYS